MLNSMLRKQIMLFNNVCRFVHYLKAVSVAVAFLQNLFSKKKLNIVEMIWLRPAKHI